MSSGLMPADPIGRRHHADEGDGMPGGSSRHPIELLLDDLERTLVQGSDTPAWSLSPAQLAAVLPRLAQLERRLEALRLGLLAAADSAQVGVPIGAANTAAWWAVATQRERPVARRDIKLANRLDEAATSAGPAHLPQVPEAVQSGAISARQAEVILDAVDALPSDLISSELRSEVGRHLVTLAEHHDPRELRILGRRVLDVLAPDIAEQHQARVLESEEREAAASATFSMGSDGHGSMWGRFKVPLLAGQMLAKHLEAIAAPRHQATRVPEREAISAGSDGPIAQPLVSRPLRLGQAFVEYLETRAAESTPKSGGLAATVVVTMTLENLLGRSEQAALIDSEELISAGEARRLACEAGIIPAVLGSSSQPLDVGRTARFHTAAQRAALALRDRGCAAEGCDWPPGRCHAHHPTPWSRGGGTSVVNGVLLCPRHHAMAHDARYRHQADARGKLVFTSVSGRASRSPELSGSRRC